MQKYNNVTKFTVRPIYYEARILFQNDFINFDSNLNASVKSLLTGQFHVKRTRFEVTISKSSFLDLNMLVRPHEVH